MSIQLTCMPKDVLKTIYFKVYNEQGDQDTVYYSLSLVDKNSNDVINLLLQDCWINLQSLFSPEFSSKLQNSFLRRSFSQLYSFMGNIELHEQRDNTDPTSKTSSLSLFKQLRNQLYYVGMPCLS